MPRYATDDGKGTNDPEQATKSPSGQPVSNSARDLWVTETALSTALNVSYMADQLGNFGLVVGSFLGAFMLSSRPRRLNSFGC